VAREIIDMLQASKHATTGYGMTTDPRQTLPPRVSRLETWIAMAGSKCRESAVRSQIFIAVN